MNSGKSREHEEEGKCDDLLIMEDASYCCVEPTVSKSVGWQVAYSKAMG